MILIFCGCAEVNAGPKTKQVKKIAMPIRFMEAHASGCCSRRPLRIEACPVIKGFLRTDAGGRKSGVEIGAPDSLPLRQSFAEKCCEAADKGVARAGTVDALHAKSGHMVHAVAAGEKRAVRAQRNDHATDPARQKMLRAL